MSLLGLFDIGKSALFASQTALSVTSHNIANVNVPGYSRQEVILSISSPVPMKNGYLGTGVTAAGIRRYYDGFIQSQLLGQYQNHGRSLTLNLILSQVEAIFNETQDTGLLKLLTDYFNAWQEVATNPEELPQRMTLLQKSNVLVSTAQRIERGILDILKHTNEEINDAANRINSLASDIASLNEKISQIETGSNSIKANDLRDQRNNLLNELSKLTNFASYETEDGSINITMGMRSLVYGKTANTLSTRINLDGSNDLYIDGINITSQINKGALGGLIAVRGEIESSYLQGIRRLIASITKAVNLLHRAGYGLDASTGNNFFNPLQISMSDNSAGADITASITNESLLTLDEYNISFDAASNYYVYNRQTGALVTSGAYVSGAPISFEGITATITGGITANDSFSVSPLTDAVRNFSVAVSDTQKIAASSTNTGLPGNNVIALQIARLTETVMSDINNSTFTDYFRGFVSNIGTMSRASSDSLTFDANLLAEINSRRESVSGVSLDEEAANLIRFQRSFEAAAKMINVADELMEVILKL